MRARLVNTVLSLAIVLSATMARSQTEAPDAPSLTRPPRVVDSLGQVIGTFYPDQENGNDSDIALARMIGRAFSLEVTAKGFIERDSDAFVFLHLTTDCSGDRYKGVYTVPLTERSGQSPSINNKTLWAAQLPLGDFFFLSRENFPKGADLSQPGNCSPQGGGPNTAGLLTSVSLARFVPPFKVVP